MNCKKKGFTIVEMMIAVFITSIILVAAISLYIYYWRSFATGNTALDIYSNSRIAMGWLAKDLRSGANILGQSTITSGYTTSDNCIVLQVPSLTHDVYGNIAIVPSQFDEVIYKVQNGKLYQIACPFTTGLHPSIRLAQNHAIADHCDSVTFYKVDTSAGTWTSLSGLINQLSTINNVGVSLPVNETTLSFSGITTHSNLITPTMVVRLRNK